jgi:hypothetical protein
VTLISVLITLAFLILIWKLGPRRRSEPGFKYVYVNQDGTVRELSPGEQVYLSTKFMGGDGARPYIKTSYESRDGWGSRSGYIRRRQVPAQIKILSIHPEFDKREMELEYDMLGSNRVANDIIETNADGSITCTPNPKISRKERFEIVRNYELEQQRRREELAFVLDKTSNETKNA